LGGDGIADRGTALAVDNEGNVFVTGSTDASNFPVTEGAFDQTIEGYYDVFVTKLATGSDEPDSDPTPTPTPTPLPIHGCGPTPLGEITVGDTPRGIGVDPARNRVYTANYGGNSVSVIDSTTNSVLQTIDDIPSANGLTYDPTNNIIWVSNYDLNLLTPIQADEDAANFDVLPVISIGNGPWGVAYEPVHNYIYVANSLDNSVSVVDAATQTVVATIANSFNQPFHLSANTRNGKVYVANFGHNSVSIVDGTAVSGVVQLWDSGRPYGITVDETRDVIYVATIHTHRIVAIGPLHGQPDQFLGWAAFQRGYNPNRPVPLRAIAVNPHIGSPFDGGHVWATTATVDGGEANQALFIPKGWSSYFHVPFVNNVDVNPTEGLAVDRVNNRVYVTGGTTPGEVTVIGDHANICPGVAPAALPGDTEQISIDVLSIADLTRSDVTGDGWIDIFDLAFIAARFGSGDLEADITGDGSVDIFDLSIVASNYGRQTPGLNLK
jgi:YVTN family beta-propeller protein